MSELEVTRALPRHLGVAQEFRRRSLDGAVGQFVGATEVAVAVGQHRVAFAGLKCEDPRQAPAMRVCMAEQRAGEVVVRQLTDGSGVDRAPTWSPDGSRLAFLSTRADGIQKPFLLSPDRPDDLRAFGALPGSAESVAWSAGGKHLLVVIADLGADRAGSAGSGRITPEGSSERSTWLPHVERGEEWTGWRHAWAIDAETGNARRLTPAGLNVWAAAWLGDTSIAVIGSDSPSESAWYDAELTVVDTVSGRSRLAYRPTHQLAGPFASSDGTKIAVIDAFSSDRDIVAGDLVVVDVASLQATRIETPNVDVTHAQWLDSTTLVAIGARDMDTVGLRVDLVSRAAHQTWEMSEGCGGWHPHASWASADRAFLVRDSYTTPPELVCIDESAVQPWVSFRVPGSAAIAKVAGTLQRVEWAARDGLTIAGLLARPDRPGPLPLVWMVHGGPVWCYRSRWIMGSLLTPLLVSRGYAVLHANPRGSAGRGQAFATEVHLDAAGEETHDHVLGVDALIERSIADPDRIAVMGESHGGYMTCWLVTQTDRFAAAVALAPVSDLISNHYTSNIPALDALLTQNGPPQPGDRMSTRSPIFYVDRVRTPTMLVAGALDDCTPPGQAVEFHRALARRGVPTELVIYPEEGHGLRQVLAIDDEHARVLDWLDKHLRVDRAE